MSLVALKADCLPATLAEYLKSALDQKLASLPDDQARYQCLSQQWNVWQQKHGRFIAASVLPLGMPAEFSFGPYGIITASDFIMVLTDIDARKTALERVPA